jgi:hypothetical protein
MRHEWLKSSLVRRSLKRKWGVEEFNLANLVLKPYNPLLPSFILLCPRIKSAIALKGRYKTATVLAHMEVEYIGAVFAEQVSSRYRFSSHV